MMEHLLQKLGAEGGEAGEAEAKPPVAPIEDVRGELESLKARSSAAGRPLSELSRSFGPNLNHFDQLPLATFSRAAS